jgi:heptosyltransferase-2
MELAITPDDLAQAQPALQLIENRKSKIENPLITFVPGANFGSSKCYPPEHFATLATALIQNHNATILLAGSPAETPLITAIIEHAKRTQDSGPGGGRTQDSFISLPALNDNRGLPLGALKELIRRSRLVIANDTGPRHFAAAFRIPTVTLFGPTDPRWAETYHKNERIVRLDVPCGPCQLKKCPIDHRCLRNLTPDLVLSAAEELLR